MINIILLIKQVYSIAKERDNNIKKFGKKRLSTSPEGYKAYKAYLDSPQYMKIETANQILRDYLESLERKEVGMLLTIMYLGKDRNYNEQASYTERLNSLYSSLHAGSNKEIEVNMLMEKADLSQYLKEGAKIIGIDV
ncbi:MAG: hypothetical protein K0R57_4814 [Paenibacillaceae bacterium]|jgi:hypothetical protein|nr:hypothetical protein [Paenibacillaceae bacterium]